MINLLNICRKNRETFYDYSTGELTGVAKKRIVKFLLASGMTLFFFDVDDDFFSTIITIYSILIGFSFSILFFLLSINFENPEEEKILEAKIQKKKLNQLLKELFYNVSYFNLLSLLLIFMALLSFIPSGASEWINRFQETYIHASKYEISFTHILVSIRYLFLFLFYYLLINSSYSLLRTTERVSYYFQEKMGFK